MARHIPQEVLTAYFAVVQDTKSSPELVRQAFEYIRPYIAEGPTCGPKVKPEPDEDSPPVERPPRSERTPIDVYTRNRSKPPKKRYTPRKDRPGRRVTATFECPECHYPHTIRMFKDERRQLWNCCGICFICNFPDPWSPHYPAKRSKQRNGRFEYYFVPDRNHATGPFLWANRDECNYNPRDDGCW